MLNIKNCLKCDILTYIMKKGCEFLKFSSLARRRTIILGVIYFIQIALLAAFSALAAFSTQSYTVLSLISSLLFSVIILNARSQPEFKTAWIIIVLLLPIFGGLLYLFLRRQTFSENYVEKRKVMEENIEDFAHEQRNILDDYPNLDPDARHLSQFITETFHVVPSNTTESTYMPSGEKMFESMLNDLNNAKDYIFIEFYIIEKGYMLDQILEVLFRKAKEGVDVRLTYDDVGNILRIDEDFIKYLNDNGVKTSVFNPLGWRLSFQYNYRNHRKIVVIDGKIGYTGGINIGDNYINKIEKAGHWKDGGIRLEGSAVWGFTLMFLSLWNSLNDEQDNYEAYYPDYEEVDPVTKGGFLQPFTDVPTHKVQISESLYLKLIYNAKETIYLKTPYLIFSKKLYSALENAAISGVDVRIITPGQPDKKLVYETTQSFYEQLVDVGVQIYEYTPGFIHEKVLIIDDDYAINGTINFDYRSFYHSFECGVLFYRIDCINHMKNDFLELFPKCELMTKESLENKPLHIQFIRSILQLVAPLM